MHKKYKHKYHQKSENEDDFKCSYTKHTCMEITFLFDLETVNWRENGRQSFERQHKCKKPKE